MVKNGLKAALVSLSLVLTLSCTIAPTYSRRDIDKSIKKICEEEFNINVKSWLVQDTIWVYAPFKKVFDDNFSWEKETLENVRKIFLALSRVLLSMDERPSFFIFVVSDVEKSGSDLYYIGFIPDMMKMQKLFISLGQWQEREVIMSFLNPQALGDYQGYHIKKYNLTMGEFISYLINQNVRKYFTAPQTKDVFQINNLKTGYANGKLSILLDISVIKDDATGLADPLRVTKETAGKLLKIYSDFDEISEIEIIDAVNNRQHSYSKKELLGGS
ncbi:MAG: hypothetical protein JSV34_01595 [Candidatus Omnitrophota bacterium]|nr:MAG: hypothetical protein JSV34_01595 [Candidatus Omnitrophota bacterium]